MTFRQQAWTLALKNLRIIVWQHGFATIVRAVLLPLVIASFLGFVKNLFIPPSVFGIGSPRPVRSLPDALNLASRTGRNTVAFVHNGFTGGDIERVIDALVPVVAGAGKQAPVLSDSAALQTICPSTLRGTTQCAGAVVFNSSPQEGPGGIWNYTILVDGGLGTSINVNTDTNDGEVYLLPLQRTVDAAIANLHGQANESSLPSSTDVYAFTSITADQRNINIRKAIQLTIVDFLAVAFLIGFVGICYHQVGFMASERETGMSQLLEAMMPARSSWEAQAARLYSYHLAFCMVYMPGWIVSSLIVARAVWATSSVLIILVHYILSGVALSSMSLLGAAFFRKSKLSGITVTIAICLLGILAQSISYPNTGAVIVLSLLFTPCAFVYFLTFVARFELNGVPADLKVIAPDSQWHVSGIVLWVFIIIQLIVYPLLAMYVERYLYGTNSRNRVINMAQQQQHQLASTEYDVQLSGFTKIYRPGYVSRLFSFVRTPKVEVVAVKNVNLNARQGQILALLGANGSGKSTTLDAISGVIKPTEGTIAINGVGGLGFCPQKNVLWDELTVFEHVKVFNHLKAPGRHATDDEIRSLVRSVDLEAKMKAKAKTLSGGQKRKLQLGAMLTGASSVCCVDEVSSGLDPLSRRKIWDILLAERGRRTIIMTTHFLDEADLLADHIVMLSKGEVRCQGSSVELKESLGAGYRIVIPDVSLKQAEAFPDVEEVPKVVSAGAVTYLASSSSLAARVVSILESEDVHNYDFSGPKIEDVFLKVAQEMQDDENGHEDRPEGAIEAVKETDKKPLVLASGTRTSFLAQFRTLLAKRLVVFQSNVLPNGAAFLIPVIAAGLTTLCIKGQVAVGCDAGAQTSSNTHFIGAFDTAIPSNVTFLPTNWVAAGPSARFSNSTIQALFGPIAASELAGLGLNRSQLFSTAVANVTQAFMNTLHLVDSYDDFTNFIVNYRANVTPAGIWLGDGSTPPTIAYKGNALLYTGMFGQAYMDVMLSNTSIVSNYAWFNIPWAPSTGNALQLLAYFGLAACVYPGFFALYPFTERKRGVRSLEYSNGVRYYPLWLSYLAFDFAFVVASMAVMCIIYAVASDIWYGSVGYLFLIFTLYGLAALLFSYVVGLFCGSQLSAYAFTAAGQAVFFLVYLIAYFCILTYSNIVSIDRNLLIAHFVISAFAPIASVIRTLFLTLNLFSAACDGFQLASNPAAMTVYGGPILYLIVQCLILFTLLIWIDSGAARTWWEHLWQRRLAWLHRRSSASDALPRTVSDEEVAEELARVASHRASVGQATAPAQDGLSVLHVTKYFGKTLAVDNVTFGVKNGEVFALLGPNGAGKSTIISLIRGDIRPSRLRGAGSGSGGDILIGNLSVSNSLSAVRTHLGVCPQFDAIDQMTVRQHLSFYAAIQGVPVADRERNVDAVLRAVGLAGASAGAGGSGNPSAAAGYEKRWAASLSGGNKRKLSLAIALMGNPDVILLDEPSSGLDAAAKRVMWRTLGEAVAPGRSILLTTHSMEEADALAGRAGILAKRMLAVGSPAQLRRRFGDALLLHIVCRGAPRTGEREMNTLRKRLLAMLPGAEMEGETMYFGQARLLVPSSAVLGSSRTGTETEVETGEENGNPEKKGDDAVVSAAALSGTTVQRSALGRLVVLMEQRKEGLSIESYSVGLTTLDQVFLSIVGKHNVQEEDAARVDRD